MKRSTIFSGRAILVSAAFFLICMILIQSGWVGAAGVNRASQGAAIPDMLFSYAPGQLGPMFQELGEAGRRSYLSMNSVDFFFAAAYGYLIFVTLGWLADRLFPGATAARLAAVLPLLGALADEVENLIFRGLALDPVSASAQLSGIASVATTAKWLLLYLSFGLAVAGLAVVALRAAAKRRGSRT